MRNESACRICLRDIIYNPRIKTELNDVRDYIGHSVPCSSNPYFPCFGRDNNKYPLGQKEPSVLLAVSTFITLYTVTAQTTLHLHSPKAPKETAQRFKKDFTFINTWSYHEIPI